MRECISEEKDGRLTCVQFLQKYHYGNEWICPLLLHCEFMPLRPNKLFGSVSLSISIMGGVTAATATMCPRTVCQAIYHTCYFITS
jgi:hypothetical protein